MLTDKMTIFILEFCECDVCPSNVCQLHIHNCHIHSFLLWILMIMIMYQGNMKLLTFKSAPFLSYRYASHSANCLIRYKRYEIVNVTLDGHAGRTRLMDTKVAPIPWNDPYSGANKKKSSKLRVTGLCVGNSLVTGEFFAQMASNAENVSI